MMTAIHTIGLGIMERIYGQLMQMIVPMNCEDKSQNRHKKTDTETDTETDRARESEKGKKLKMGKTIRMATLMMNIFNVIVFLYSR